MIELTISFSFRTFSFQSKFKEKSKFFKVNFEYYHIPFNLTGNGNPVLFANIRKCIKKLHPINNKFKLFRLLTVNQIAFLKTILSRIACYTYQNIWESVSIYQHCNDQYKRVVLRQYALSYINAYIYLYIYMTLNANQVNNIVYIKYINKKM